MADISASAVKELREKTGAGMMDCKKALAETEGDMAKAMEWLRKKGIASAGKKSDRLAAEGLVDSYTDVSGRVGVLVEINCETDFVARREEFQRLVQSIAKQAVDASSVEVLLTQPATERPEVTVTEWIKETIAQVGENIQVRRFDRFALAEGSNGLVGSYIHTGGRVGVLVELSSESEVSDKETFSALVRNIAMQVAACPNVEYVQVADIPDAVAQKEKEIEMGRDDLSNKPENVREKIVQGRIDKRLKEITLLDQPFIRDQSITVEELIKQNAAQLGSGIQVQRFSRFVLGEGVEKPESNFAEEVAAQAGLT
jgi:elongation factor Ts